MPREPQTARPPHAAADSALAYLLDLEQHGIKLGLDNSRTLTAALEHPERHFTSILVAGTNGKGSVAAMIERGLRSAGYRTGLYTSPHLIDLSERFALNGQPVDAPTLSEAAIRIRDTIETLRRTHRLDAPPTFFEATTALALALFERAGTQVAVLEVGMGGRFDATNVVTPAAVAIPSIDVDHQQFLGSTLAEIAFEKAGVIDAEVVVVTAEAKPAARDVLRDVADERGARFVEVDGGLDASWHIDNGATRIETLTTPRGQYGPLTLALRGRHQVRNAMVAVRLLEELRTAGVDVPRSAIEEALVDVRWRGRLELVELRPDRRVLLDPAHNVAAADALAGYVREIRPTGLPFIFGALRDKDVTGMLQALGPAATALICVPIASPRALPLPELVDVARAARPDLSVTAAGSLDAALDAMWDTDTLGVAAGSVYLVGELIRMLDARVGATSEATSPG